MKPKELSTRDEVKIACALVSAPGKEARNEEAAELNQPPKQSGAKFVPGESVVKKFAHWHVVVRGRQVTLGDVTFVLTRTVDSLGDVTPEEFAEFPQAVRWFERAARSLFAPDRIDYSVMLTHDPHVHLDAFPRYGREIDKYGNTWNDTDYPDAVSGHAVETLSRDQHHQLCADYASQG